MVRLKVRVFTFPSDPTKQNSYVVGTVEGGQLPVVGTIKVEDPNVETISFSALRSKICSRNDRGMMRRTIMFQEISIMMYMSANPHDYPQDMIQTFHFGYFSTIEQEIPTVLSSKEEDYSIAKYLNMITTDQTGDLIIIPHTQIGPICKQCCKDCISCSPSNGNQSAIN